jgi:hypothetical protein
MKFAFPDEGAFKRFGKPLQKYCPSLYRDGNVVICGKVKISSAINFFCHVSPCRLDPVFVSTLLADACGRRPPNLDH